MKRKKACTEHEWYKGFVLITLAEAYDAGLIAAPVTAFRYAYCVRCRKVLL